MNRLVVLGVAIVAVLYVLVSSIYVVNEREQAIAMRFGQITAVNSEPGLYFKVPTNVVDTVQIIEDRLLRYDVANMTLQVSGGKFYLVDAFLTYRISNPRLFRERALGELRLVEDRIATRFTAALRQVYGLREFNAALSAERTEMMREARDLIRGDMAELGIEVVDVRILRTDLTQEVSAQTFERMKAERLAEAAFLRARGQEAAQSLRAIADRQAVEIVASARRDSEILRGEGDAQRNAVFASAFGQDPEFFEFYRSMQAYRTSLSGEGTTMLLTPESEFFSYFNADAPAGGAPPPAAPDGIEPLPSSSLSVPAAPDIPIETDLSESPLAIDAPATEPAAPVAPAETGPLSSEPVPTDLVAPEPVPSEPLPSEPIPAQ